MWPLPSKSDPVDEISDSRNGQANLPGQPRHEEALISEFDAEERSLLLNVAHDSILSALENRSISLDAPTPHLNELRGVFNSLYLAGRLRGCVGYVLPVYPVYRAVAETARAAAFDDDRFTPVTITEAPQLEIQLSILTPPSPITADEIEIGRHGLVITDQGRRGLLLPQVPVEHGWDRITFLQETCRKAGLPPDMWQRGAAIEAFSAEIFGDKSEENWRRRAGS